MRSHRRFVSQLVRASCLLFLSAGALGAMQDEQSGQGSQQVLRGRVADAMDRPIAGAVVLLHSVGEAAGLELDRDTADADGRFSLDWQQTDSDALYFVATRLEGEIYMLEPFRTLPTEEVVLRAGAGVEPLRMDGLMAGPNGGATQPTAPPAGAGDRHRGWWAALIGAVLVGIVAWLVHRGRHRPTLARELMAEIARLDERHAAAGTDRKAQASETYRTRRAELHERLTEALALDQHAHRH